MRSEFTEMIERDGDWFVAWSPEIPEANAQGRTVAVRRENLETAIQLVLDDHAEDRRRQ